MQLFRISTKLFNNLSKKPSGQNKNGLFGAKFKAIWAIFDCVLFDDELTPPPPHTHYTLLLDFGFLF